jgi:crotonobetainyl-CoA:carnitine CoA-transferase CaiB-like acyl-CoA transferase
MMLADMGARVIKVEDPKGGDESRRWGPPFVGPADDQLSTYFLAANRNKESVAIDLKTDDGRSYFTALVARADVLLENFRPGVLDRLGFGVEQLQALNPRLVILSITGFGHDGPEGVRAGYDQIAQGESGLMSMTGPPGEPTKVGVPIGDLLAGIYGAFGVVTALMQREQTGRGEIVRTSLLAALVATQGFQGTRWTVGHVLPTGEGNVHPSISPYGLFRAADGPVQIAIGGESAWLKLAGLLGISADDPRYLTNANRIAHRAELIRAINTALATNPAAHWLELLDAAGIPAGKVRTLDDVYAWEQTRSQGLVVEVQHPVLGTIELPGPPIRLGKNDFAGGRAQHTSPPALGEHTDSVRAWLNENPDTTQKN